MPTRLIVNERAQEVDAPPDTPLLYVLTNDLALHVAPAEGLIRIETTPPLFRQVNLVRRPEKALSLAAQELWRIILNAPIPSGVTDLRQTPQRQSVGEQPAVAR